MIKENQKNAPEKSFNEQAAALNLTVTQTTFFNKGQYLPNIGIAKEFQETAFALNDQNKISEVVETEKGTAILHLDQRGPLNQEEFLKEKDQFAKTLTEERKNDAFNDFLSLLRIKANLLDNVSKLKARQQEK